MNNKPVVFLIDDDTSVLKTLSRAIEQYHFEVRPFSSAREFLDNYEGEHGCLVLDLSMPEMNGLELQDELSNRGQLIQIIFITGHGGVSDSVKALRNGAFDFLEKPFRTDVLLQSIEEAIKLDAQSKASATRENQIRQRITKLTERERIIFDLLIDAIETPSSKSIARELDISHRTVEHHRSRILEKLEVRSVVELRLTVGNVLRLVGSASVD